MCAAALVLMRVPCGHAPARARPPPPPPQHAHPFNNFVLSHSTVADVIARMAAETGRPVATLRLFRHGRVLSPTDTLERAGVRALETLRLQTAGGGLAGGARWQCDQCSAYNSGSRDEKCAECGVFQAWVCGLCSQQNASWRATCANCTGSRADAVKGDEGPEAARARKSVARAGPRGVGSTVSC